MLTARYRLARTKPFFARYVARGLSEEAAEPVAAAAAAEAKSEAEVIAGLNNEIKHLKDQLLRSYAEGENIRRIAHRDVDNAKSYSVSSFAKATLDIADDLDRALAVVPVEKKASADPTLAQLVEGIELTHKNLAKVQYLLDPSLLLRDSSDPLQALAQFGVVKYGAVGEKFDPNKHEALFRIPDAANPDTVGQVVKVGYMIKDRVLRVAQVGARVKPDA